MSADMNRRRFMRTGAAAVAAVAAGASGNFVASAADDEAIKKTRSYSPEMEYRRLGSTGLWVSAVCFGGHWKRVGKVTGQPIPMQLDDDEFFCIGDNNPLSDDGRFWGPDPSTPDALWVRQRYFDKPVYDNSRDGIVPRQLMMGRAFFVYFPAPYSWTPNGMGVIPNFADMRFIH